jgi:L-asparaginase / beta-aspartyl-peptidase
MWSIIVHGGAGAIKASVGEKHQAGCRRAVEAGRAVLAAGGASIDAVQAAVRVLEDDPTFNAGLGASLDERGLPAVDASIMRGSDLAYGAIGAVVGIKNAVDVARAVLDDGRHALLVGPSALDFARKKNLPIVDPRTLETQKARLEWEKRREQLAKGGTGPIDWTPPEPDAPHGDTVGAAALDEAGNFAAATSTGGLTMRYAGRVGDSPIAGAGNYARNDMGAASATGHGETMMRTVFTYRLLSALKGVQPELATAMIRAELDDASRRCGGNGGAIVVLSSGAVAWARNTPHMGVAWAQSDGREGTDF